MSYISDALRKARKVKSKEQQQVKKSIWHSLRGASSDQSPKNDAWQKKYTVIGLSITFLYAVGVIAVMYWSDIKSTLMPATAYRGPARVTVAPINVPREPNLPKPVLPAQTAVAPSGSPVLGKVDTPNIPVTAAPANVKKDQKSEPPADIETEPPVKKVAGDPKKLYAQALKKQQDGHLEEARELYRQVIKLQPANVKALNNLGVVYMKMKRSKWAIARLNEAIRFKPSYADAHYNLACLYAQLNNTQKSLFYLKKAVELNPEAKNWAAQDGDFKGLENITEYKNIIQVQDN